MTSSVLDAAKFTPHVGENFVLTSEGAGVTSVLAKVAEYPASTAPGSTRTAFSLFLNVKRGDVSELQSGPYVLEHHSLGVVGPIHVERVLSSQPELIRLEAAFN